MKTSRPQRTYPLAILATIFLSLATSAARADEPLDWAKTSLFFETGFDDESVEATYSFTNTSDQTIIITDTKATCGCTVPSLEKDTYEPGESGELTAIFTIGSRQGLQHKSITVAAEDTLGDTSTYELKLEVDIPVPITFNPRVRFWKMNESAKTQDIEIFIHKNMPMEIAGLIRKDVSEPPSFDYEIETVEPGLHYLVKLTPKQPNQKSRDVFFIESPQDQKDVLSKFPIYAYIR